MRIKMVARTEMPAGHTWAIIERDGEVTILAIDAFAARVARLAYSSSRS